MTKIPEPRDPTLEAVDQAIVRNTSFEPRSHLGASEIGHSCDRRLWYKFHHVEPDHIDAQGLRNIGDGNRGEPIMSDRLDAVPEIKIHIIDPKTGGQLSLSAIGGHFRGSMDGLIKGLLQAPKTWHIWEHKQVNEKRFRDLERKKEKFGEKEALEQWDETYYAQAQCYMGLSKEKTKDKPNKIGDRHYMTVATPGGRQITSVRTNFSELAFDIYMEKAQNIIKSSSPPPRVSSKADFYICKWCNFNELCHSEEKTAKVNCRTCAHSTAVVDPLGYGVWRCEHHDMKLSKSKQAQGCPNHLFIPELIPWAHVHQMDKIHNTITYRTDKGTEFINAEHNLWGATPKHFTSKDLQHINAGNIDNDDLHLEHFAKFEPSIISINKAKTDQLDDALPEWL